METKPMASEAASRLMTALLSVGELEIRSRAVPHVAVPGSLWADDLAASATYGRLVGLYAAQAIGSGIDHLRAWCLLAERAAMGPGSPWTLARGVLEGATRALWHLDPRDAGERLARAFAARRQDQEERRKFEDAPGPGPRLPLPAGGKTADQRLAILEHSRHQEGIASVRYEGPTAIARAFNVERHYRLASGYAHALEYAMGHGGDVEWLDSIPTNPGIRAGFITANDEQLGELAVTASRSLGAAIDALEAYATVHQSREHGASD